jgi:hypothetical protein
MLKLTVGALLIFALATGLMLYLDEGYMDNKAICFCCETTQISGICSISGYWHCEKCCNKIHEVTWHQIIDPFLPQSR